MSVLRGSLNVTTIHAVLTSQGGTTVSAEAVSMTMEPTHFPGSPVLVSKDQWRSYVIVLHGVVSQRQYLMLNLECNQPFI